MVTTLKEDLTKLYQFNTITSRSLVVNKVLYVS